MMRESMRRYHFCTNTADIESATYFVRFHRHDVRGPKEIVSIYQSSNGIVRQASSKWSMPNARRKPKYRLTE